MASHDWGGRHEAKAVNDGLFNSYEYLFHLIAEEVETIFINVMYRYRYYIYIHMCTVYYCIHMCTVYYCIHINLCCVCIFLNSYVCVACILTCLSMY